MIDTIIQGDCLEVMPNIPDKSIDMILCDLPYGTTACKWDTIIPFDPLWAQYKRIIKDNGAIVLTASQPFTSALVMSNPDMFRYEWIWNKNTPTGFLNAKNAPLKQHESICVFSFGKHIYNPQMVLKEYKGFRSNENHSKGKLPDGIYGNNLKKSGNRSDYRYPKTIIEYQAMSGHNAGEHPTQKPVALFEYLIKTYTNEGDTVLDNCAGSGTTAIACIKTKRQYILIEKEKKYIEIANRRIDGQTPPML